MFIFELIATAVGVSMDAFSVSICKGLGMKRVNFVQAAIIGLVFGGFQAAMPLIGFLVVFGFQDTEEFQNAITQNAPLVTLVLLGFIGGKMIIDAVRGKSNDDVARAQKLNDEGRGETKLNIIELLMLGLATSIDALMVGFAFAVIQADVILTITVIGLTTFAFSFAGVFIGHFFSAK
ncbi:MAG: manganese efflux pump [Coriobacteriia bacterium]|nr:manganese efflux pump [Coriobacteriia bacterium]